MGVKEGEDRCNSAEITFEERRAKIFHMNEKHKPTNPSNSAYSKKSKQKEKLRNIKVKPQKKKKGEKRKTFWEHSDKDV